MVNPTGPKRPELWHNLRRVGCGGGSLSTARRRVPGSGVELEICALSDAPPGSERIRLERALRDLYPESAASPLLVIVAWSAPGRHWLVRIASQRVASAGFVDCTREVADRLGSAGLAAQTGRYPLDSPPDGVPLTRRS